jgi:putative transcriptional regulator
MKNIRIPFVDVEEVRRGTGLSVEDFAKRFGLTAASVRSWEQGVTQPYGVARILLAIIACHPEIVDEVLRSPPTDRWNDLSDR